MLNCGGCGQAIKNVLFGKIRNFWQDLGISTIWVMLVLRILYTTQPICWEPQDSIKKKHMVTTTSLPPPPPPTCRVSSWPWPSSSPSSSSTSSIPSSSLSPFPVSWVPLVTRRRWSAAHVCSSTSSIKMAPKGAGLLTRKGVVLVGGVCSGRGLPRVKLKVSSWF